VSKCNLKNEAKINKIEYPEMKKEVTRHRLGLIVGLWNKSGAKFHFKLKRR